MRVNDKPLPGDLVIREQEDRSGLLVRTVWVITSWPDADQTIAGPYQSYGYALRQARGRLKDRSEQIWRNHGGTLGPERLENVTLEH